MKRVLPLVVAALIAGCGPADPIVGTTLPERTVTEVTTGRAVDLSAFKGKVVLIDFWATWCGPCLDAIPEIQKMHDDWAGRGLHVAGVSGESASVLSSFLKRNPLTYAVYQDSEDGLGKHFDVSAIPTVVVVGRDGKVVYRAVGPEPSEVRSAVEKALARS